MATYSSLHDKIKRTIIPQIIDEPDDSADPVQPNQPAGTYVELHDKIRENINVDFNSRESDQVVKLTNPNNEFTGSFHGDIEATEIKIAGGELSNVVLVNAKLGPDGYELSDIQPTFDEYDKRIFTANQHAAQAERTVSDICAEISVEVSTSFSNLCSDLCTEVSSQSRKLNSVIESLDSQLSSLQVSDVVQNISDIIAALKGVSDALKLINDQL